VTTIRTGAASRPRAAGNGVPSPSNGSWTGRSSPIIKAVGRLPVPMLAELAGLDRKSAGRVLVATIAANVDDIGSTSTTPWRVMSWEPRGEAAPHLVDGEIVTLRNELEDALVTIDKLRACIEQAISKLN
jgi:hypothetical protein